MASRVRIAEDADSTVLAFFWEFVRIAKVETKVKWPLFYLTEDGARRESPLYVKSSQDHPSRTLEQDLDHNIRNRLKDGCFGRGDDGTFCVRDVDGTWWTLQTAYRFVVNKNGGVQLKEWCKSWKPISEVKPSDIFFSHALMIILSCSLMSLSDSVAPHAGSNAFLVHNNSCSSSFPFRKYVKT